MPLCRLLEDADSRHRWRNLVDHEYMTNREDPQSDLSSAICAESTIRSEPDAQQRQIVRNADGRKVLKRWLGALDDFRNWLIREAA
jgi:hypothetical protein